MLLVELFVPAPSPPFIQTSPPGASTYDESVNDVMIFCRVVACLFVCRLDFTSDLSRGYGITHGPVHRKRSVSRISC